MQLNHEIYNMLDLGGCSTEPEFDQDLCTDARAERTSLKKLGCTTPFGPNKDKICQDQESGSKALKIYKDMFVDNVNNCHRPCSFVVTKAIKTRQTWQNGNKNYSSLTIYFDEYIKITDAHYLYSGLSLIAEIGGYVGLFLGVSINQVSILMHTLLDKIDCLSTEKTI